MDGTTRLWSFKRIVATVTGITLVGLMACAELPGSKRTQGAVAGGAGGAVLGGATGGTKGAIWGGLIGAGLGYLIGWGWEEYDARQLNDTLETNPEGQASTWTNPNTGKAYTATPVATKTQGVQPCRDVRIEPAEGGREPVVATACREQDGTWRLANQ